MKNRHLSEKEIQLYAEETQELNPELSLHLIDCPVCREDLNTYKAIFADVKALKRPEFDFDLSELVLEQLPVKTTARAWGKYFALALSIVAMLVCLDVLSAYFGHVFKALPTALLLMVAVPALLILLFQGTEAIKIYREKINSIKAGRSLQ